MDSLSDEIILRIFRLLTARDLCRCSQVTYLSLAHFIEPAAVNTSTVPESNKKDLPSSLHGCASLDTI